MWRERPEPVHLVQTAIASLAQLTPNTSGALRAPPGRRGLRARKKHLKGERSGMPIKEKRTLGALGAVQHARSIVAVSLGRTVAAASRTAGRGNGAVIGGKVALRLDPQLLARLAKRVDVVLVSGTNGKTTTTRLISEGLRPAGPVMSNALGANMPAGITTALARSTHARLGVLEVDERYLATVARDTDPMVIALLNLARDQLDRAGETRLLAQRWREGLSGTSAVVIANADDPLVVWAASSCRNVVWVAAGQAWREDSWSCPACGGVLHRPGHDWFCADCEFQRPEPNWSLAGSDVIDPRGEAWPIQLRLPGRANLANAAIATAVAGVFEVPPNRALQQMSMIEAVAGRYGIARYGGRDIRLLLAKNPAGWLETFTMIDDPGAPIVLAVNALEADGTDTSWLWDVDFDRLADHPVFIMGERKKDLAVRLEVAGVQFRLVDSLAEAVAAAPAGRIEAVANYTAFQQIRRTLAKDARLAQLTTTAGGSRRDPGCRIGDDQ